MKDFFRSPLRSNDGSLTLVGFFWMMVAVLAAFFGPLTLLQPNRAYNIGMRYKPKVGDLIFWGGCQTPGILVRRFDMYAREGESEPHAFDGESSNYPSYCWYIAWPSGNPPFGYNKLYGVLEVNMLNLGMWKHNNKASQTFTLG